jgi:hypothetical protein
VLARALFAVTAALAAAGCGGDQKMAAEANWSADPDENERPLRETEALDEEGGPQPLDAKPAASRAMVGVRPDLGLASGTGGATCACLAVVVGSPGDAKFQWQAGAPKTGADALAIAVSARGVDCPGGDPDDTKRRPSISAVDVEGNDVVIEIEELPEGAPLASGALIPLPGPGGSVYVRGRDKSVVYARPSSGGGARCKVR